MCFPSTTYTGNREETLGFSACAHSTWPGEVMTQQMSTPFLHTCAPQSSAGQWVFSGQEQSLFSAAPALPFKGSLSLLFWKPFRSDPIPGLPKHRGIEAFHPEGMGLIPMENVYVAPPGLEACKLTPFVLPLENTSRCTRFGLPGERVCSRQPSEYYSSCLIPS